MFGDFVQDAVDAVVFSFFVLVILHVIHVRDFLFVLDSHGLLPEWADESPLVKSRLRRKDKVKR